MATAICSPSGCNPVTLVLKWSFCMIDSTRLCRIFTRSRSAPGRRPGVISTTLTWLPSAA
jgi:hypothetical protein